MVLVPRQLDPQQFDGFRLEFEQRLGVLDARLATLVLALKLGDPLVPRVRSPRLPR